MGNSEAPDQFTSFIDALYGSDAKLTRDEFLKEVCNKECNWIFYPEKIRQKFMLWKKDKKMINEWAD